MAGILASNSNNLYAVFASLFSMMIGLFGMVVWLIIFGVFMLLIFGIIAFCIVVNWKLFEKAGEPGWKCIIPYYNTYTMFDISTNPLTRNILFIAAIVASVGCAIPYLNLLTSWIAFPVMTFAMGVMHYAIAKSFGMDQTMCVLNIFFSPVIMAIMAFGDAKYTGDKLVLFKENNNNNA